jgi:hypothetical protein
MLKPSPEDPMRALLVALPLLILLPVRADALTVRDIVELTRAGLGEEVLLALIEVDRSVFPVDTATLKRLKEAGVSERVIVAMVRSARTSPPVTAQIAAVEPAPPRATEPQVVVIDHHDAPQVREVPVAFPVYVPYVVRSVHAGSRDDRGRDGFRAATSHAAPVKQPEPVYWGFGGKLRPDAWQPAPDTTVKKKQN